MLNNVASFHADKLEIKLYQAGKDFSYIKKYGIITKGTLIINQKKKYDRLTTTGPVVPIIAAPNA